jgi:pimeloyl-ACP methyl ester carboxylesterase
VALLNSAGPFQDAASPTPDPNAPKPWYSSIKDAVIDVGKRVVLFFAFQRAKQPERIKEVLEMVYSSTESIDDDLVDSIVVPATDPAAAEVFYRINSSKQPSLTVNELLKQMRSSQLPLLLLWGDLDPWITPARVSGCWATLLLGAAGQLTACKAAAQPPS